MGVEAAAVKADADTDEEVEVDVDLAAIAVLKARQPNRHSIQPSQVKSFWNHLRGISRTILLMRVVLIRIVPGPVLLDRARCVEHKRRGKRRVVLNSRIPMTSISSSSSSSSSVISTSTSAAPRAIRPRPSSGIGRRRLSDGVRDVWTELGYDSQSGAISAEELSLGLARLGLPSSMLAVRQIFAEAGKDADDGVLEYAELLGYVRRREDEIMDSFARLTPRRTLARISTDAIAFADLKESLSRLGVQASDREIAVFLAQLDGQGSQRGGELGLHEFATFVYRLPRVDVAAAFESWLAARGGGLDTGAEPGQVHSSTVESTTASSEAVFLAGAVAGVISRTATAPLDRLKMLMQVGIKWAPQRPIGVVGGLRAIYAQGGFPAFFQGNTANVVKVRAEVLASACR